MRAKFEKYYKENHSDKFCCVDAALEMRGDDYIDFHAADLWALWQYCQTEVGGLKQTINFCNRMANLDYQKITELRKQVDAVLRELTSAKDGHYGFNNGGADIESFIFDLEQALKGDS